MGPVVTARRAPLTTGPQSGTTGANSEKRRRRLTEDSNNRATTAQNKLKDAHERLRHDPEFRPRWENRRKVIFVTLIFCAGCIVGIIFVPLVADLVCQFTTQVGGASNCRMDSPLVDLSNSALYVLAFVAVAVIGSYVFGSAFDSQGYRRALNEITKTLMSKP